MIKFIINKLPRISKSNEYSLNFFFSQYILIRSKSNISINIFHGIRIFKYIEFYYDKYSLNFIYDINYKLKASMKNISFLLR